MKNLLRNLFIINIFIFSFATNAEQQIISSAESYPYKNLANRTDNIKIFYTTKQENISCRVEISLDNMSWSSKEHNIDKQSFDQAPLSSCLSDKRAKQILVQTFLQFGTGL